MPLPLQTDFLLVDISNSFTKVMAASRTALLGEVFRIPTKELTPSSLRLTVGGIGFSKLVLSSVVPKAEAAVEEWVEQLNSEREAKGAASPTSRVTFLKLTCELNLGVKVDYPTPTSIGADRLANAAAVAALYGAPAVVVDYGTALTFDVVASVAGEATYVGGVIAPGLEAMTNYLHQRTALLPQIDLSEPTGVIGKSTREAMLSGAVYGYRGLVREILVELRKELNAGEHLAVVATGGYADLISQTMPEVQKVHPNLTLEGLRLIGVNN